MDSDIYLRRTNKKTCEATPTRSKQNEGTGSTSYHYSRGNKLVLLVHRQLVANSALRKQSWSFCSHRVSLYLPWMKRRNHVNVRRRSHCCTATIPMISTAHSIPPEIVSLWLIATLHGVLHARRLLPSSRDLLRSIHMSSSSKSTWIKLEPVSKPTLECGLFQPFASSKTAKKWDPLWEQM